MNSPICPTKKSDFESVSVAASELLSDLLSGYENRPVTPRIGRGEIESHFRGTIEWEGIGYDRMVEDFRTMVVPNSLSMTNPMYMGLVNSSPLPGAVIAESLVAALDNNAGASHQGPAASAAETEIIRSLAELFHFKNKWSGMFLPGGTYANLHALLLARTKVQSEHKNVGLADCTLYCSDAVHFSVTRSARVIGIESANIRSISISGRGEMNVDQLEGAIAEDRDRGKTPCAVVATFGTTGTGALDPLAQIAETCNRQEVWYHIDACYGAAAIFDESLKTLAMDLDLGDSIAIDLHKWFFMPLTSSLILSRHAEVDSACFNIDASYIPDGQPQPFQLGLPTSRRAVSLSVWAALRAHGWSTIANGVRATIDMTRLLESGLRDAGFEVLPDGKLSICCARLNDPTLPAGFYHQVAESIREKGLAWFGTVEHRGLTWFRFNSVNLFVGREHVSRMLELVVQEVKQATAVL